MVAAATLLVSLFAGGPPDNGQQLLELIDAGKDDEAIKLLIATPALLRQKLAKENRAPQDALRYAIAARRPKVVEQMLAMGAGDRLYDDEGGHERPSILLSLGDPQTLEVILRHTGRPLKGLPDGRTLLHAACEGLGNGTTVRMLADAGVPLNALDVRRDTALSIAARLANVDVVQTLIRLGADVRATDGERTRPLVDEILLSGDLREPKTFRCRAVVELLVDAGAQDSFLLRVFRSDYIAVKRELNARRYAAIGNVAAPGRPLQIAAAFGNTSVVQLLLDNGAMGREGASSLLGFGENSALEYAVDVGKLENARCIFSRYAERDRNWLTERSDFLANWASSNFAPNWADASGSTPLQEYCNRPTLVAALCEEGANPNTRDARKRTPLHNCIGNMAAAEVVRLLVRSGSNIDAKDTEGNLALHLAILNDDARAARELILAGSSLDTPNKDGKTCRDLALERHLDLKP